MMADMAGFICPVCGFDGLLEPDHDESGSPSYEICMSCGFEFGFDDDSEGVSFQDYRKQWLANGATWFDPDARPDNWDLATQLARIGVPLDGGEPEDTIQNWAIADEPAVDVTDG